MFSIQKSLLRLSKLNLRLDEASLFIAELPHDDKDEIDELPDVETSQGEDHEDPCADFSDIEAVDAEGAEKKTE